MIERFITKLDDVNGLPECMEVHVKEVSHDKTFGELFPNVSSDEEAEIIRKLSTGEYYVYDILIEVIWSNDVNNIVMASETIPDVYTSQLPSEWVELNKNDLVDLNIICRAIAYGKILADGLQRDFKNI